MHRYYQFHLESLEQLSKFDIQRLLSLAEKSTPADCNCARVKRNTRNEARNLKNDIKKNTQKIKPNNTSNKKSSENKTTPETNTTTSDLTDLKTTITLKNQSWVNNPQVQAIIDQNGPHSIINAVWFNENTNLRSITTAFNVGPREISPPLTWNPLSPESFRNHCTPPNKWITTLLPQAHEVYYYRYKDSNGQTIRNNNYRNFPSHLTWDEKQTYLTDKQAKAISTALSKLDSTKRPNIILWNENRIVDIRDNQKDSRTEKVVMIDIFNPQKLYWDKPRGLYFINYLNSLDPKLF